MSIDNETVRKIARLARIGIADAQVAPLAGELSAILGWIEQLGEVDTTGVAPMTAVIPNHLAWRVDAVTDGGVQDKVLANAPDATSGFFAVPKVIE
ncbi:MAG: Asp-tRNA(Asn)/Glu-tRNA(Gln) amidotransferase subunit GatC [Sandarakinorhabdus sp.]|nr:Asp-tRNA(Asn)/Glu-tRNA(Gln) amidotransferase subunit GatC [Sandarakinorhabdus sp.]